MSLWHKFPTEKVLQKKKSAFCGNSQAPKEMIQKIQVSRGPAVAKFISVTWQKRSMVVSSSLNRWQVPYNLPIGSIYHLYIPLIVLANWVIIWYRSHPPVKGNQGFTPLKKGWKKRGKTTRPRGLGPSSISAAEGTSRRRSATWYWYPETVTVLGVKVAHGSVKKEKSPLFGLRQ